MKRIIYIVATPLGHLGDITHRAREVLGQVDMILAEHPDHTRNLLRALDLPIPVMKSYHQHNEKQLCDWLVNQEWSEIALVSDAGTPNVHDPGACLLEVAYANGYQLVPVPGPSALTAALSLADRSSQMHMFIGFLPHNNAQKARVVESLAAVEVSLVFYEAPHRIEKTVACLLEIMGDRKAWVFRELTKQYEQVVKATLTEIKQLFSEGGIPARGEFVIIVAGSDGKRDDSSWQAAAQELSQHMSQKMVAAFVSRHFSCRKNEVYAYLLSHD